MWILSISLNHNSLGYITYYLLNNMFSLRLKHSFCSLLLASRFEEKFEEVNDVELPQVTSHPSIGPSDNAMAVVPESTQNNFQAENLAGHPLCSDFSIPQDSTGIMRIVPSDVNVSYFAYVIIILKLY